MGNSKSQKSIFYVKGLRLPLAEHEDPLLQIIEPYFWHNENILVATPSFSGKTSAFLKIFESLESDKKIIVSEKVFEKIPCIKPEMLLDIDSYDYLIFDNVIPTFKSKPKAHISIFMDYSNIEYDRNREFGYRESLISMVPENIDFTVICSKPNDQKIEFVFGTDDNIKYLTLSQFTDIPNTLAFSFKEQNSNVPNISFISSIKKDIKCRRLIFYDISVADVETALDRIDDIVFIYTKDDFKNLIEIAAIFSKRNLELPEHVKRIIEKIKNDQK